MATNAMNRPTRIGWGLRVYAVLGSAIGLWLMAGGTWLVTLGGSPYYLVAGLTVLIAAVLLWRADFRGALVYAALLVATLLWALWESGLDGWALVPRVLGPAIFGLWLLTPWALRALGRQPISLWWWGGGVAVIVATLGIAIHASRPDPIEGQSAASSLGAPTEWRAWGNSQFGTRYADIDQLTPQNVSGLQVAWTYETHAVPRPGGAMALAFETVPLKVGNMLYGCSPHNVIFAIDAATGKQIWKYDPQTDDRGLAFANCRGVAYHAAPSVATNTPCAGRIYTTTIDARLIALDARDGKPCAGFGNGGMVDLRAGIGPHAKALYYATSAPIVSGNVLVTGSYVLDGQSVNEPSGVVRGYDLVSGQMVWAFDPANPGSGAPLQPGQTFKPGTPNMWSMASTDEKLGLIYLPMGVATPDFFGGLRTPEAERFSNSVVAVDNKTGKVRWVFQTVHHDLWDYDVASQPVLTDFRTSSGQVRPALITISKTAETFVLDRETGKPLSRVIEQRVPQGAVPGDFTATTQPFSVDMPNFTGPEPNEKRAWGITPLDQLWCRIAFKKMRYEGRYTPPREDVSIMFPGSAGGVNWGSVSIDERRRIMIVNSTHMPMHNQLITAAEVVKRGMQKVQVGGPGVSLELFKLGVPQWGAPYGGITNNPFLSPLRVPCMQPPFGTVSALDLDTRKVIWSKPIGLADRMGPLGLQSLLPVTIGLPTLGGSLTTKGGLTFIATTPDRRLRAYETATGRLLWQHDMPANANANPMSYIGADGRQYVVIASGGSSALAFNDRNVLMAFAVPR